MRWAPYVQMVKEDALTPADRAFLQDHQHMLRVPKGTADLEWVGNASSYPNEKHAEGCLPFLAISKLDNGLYWRRLIQAPERLDPQSLRLLLNELEGA